MRLALALAVSLALAPRVATAQDAPPYACKVPAASTKITATFRPATPLQDLVTWVMGFTCKNVIVPADVLRRVPAVTILAPNAMTPKQALALFVDAVEATGLVVTVKADTIILKLGPTLPAQCPTIADLGTSAPPTVAPPVQPPTAEAPAPDELSKVLERGIKRSDATHYEIAAAAIDAVLANPMEVAKGARVVPAMKDGAANGFKLYAIRAGSLFGRIGLQNGDTVVAINGFAIDSADKALEVYAKLREATRLDIDLVRRGVKLTIYLTIKR